MDSPEAEPIDASALRALLDATRLIAGRADDLDATLDVLADQARRLLGADAAVGRLLSPDGVELRGRASPPGQVGHRVDHQVVGHVESAGERLGTVVLAWSRSAASSPAERATAEALVACAAAAARIGLSVEAERLGRARHDEASERLRVLVRAAAAAQLAVDESAVFDALGRAAREADLSLHVATLDPTASVLVVRHVALAGVDGGWLQRLLGRPPIGIEIPVEGVPEYRAVVREGRAVFAESAGDWLRASVPWLPAPALRTLKAALKVDQAMAAPMIDGGRVIGALSIWGPSLASLDLPAIELLGRVAGASLAGLRLRQREQERRAEAELAQAELEAIFDATDDPVLLFAADGRVLRTNRAAAEGIAGLLPHGPVGTLAELLGVARARGIEVDEPGTVAARVLRGERIDQVCRWRWPDGDAQWLHVHGAPVHDEDGRLLAAVVSVRDITDLQAQATERALLHGAVATARRVAHELNDQLQLLTSYAELLPEMGPDETRETAARIADAAQAAGQVVHRLQRIVRFRETRLNAGLAALDLEAATAPEPRAPA